MNNYISNNFSLIKLEEIGRGGFGVVFKVYDTHKNRKYALKIIKKDKNDILEDVLQEVNHEIDIAL